VASHSSLLDPATGAPRLAPPSLGGLFSAGLALGVAQAGVSLVLGSPSFLFMPITFGSLPFDVAAFCAGCLAKRHGWLDDFFGTLPPRGPSDDWPPPPPPPSAWTWSLRAGALAAAAVAFSFGWVLTYHTSGGPSGGDDDGARHKDDHAFDDDGDDNNGGALLRAFVVAVVLLGAGGVALGLWALDSSRLMLGWSSPLSVVLAEGAFAAYLIHPWVVVLLTWGAVQAMDGIAGNVSGGVLGGGAMANIAFADDDGAPGASTTAVRPPGLLVGAWAAVCCVAVPLTWAIAVPLRRLPGVRQVL
jgi:hypothetical protein